uniref:Uncharacterized protein n=1 Tax=Alexandrium andersonii TaxID=327968 RepID=A0A7S2ADT3_9DINO|mmetsp:Transcript_102895/g.231053  ORF Transcript_102895/g.231053 Transcript_102895/m.231053 type:complete len:367 (+) Transcript_102895:58-1158(+)
MASSGVIPKLSGSAASSSSAARSGAGGSAGSSAGPQPGPGEVEVKLWLVERNTFLDVIDPNEQSGTPRRQTSAPPSLSSRSSRSERSSSSNLERLDKLLLPRSSDSTHSQSEKSSSSQLDRSLTSQLFQAPGAQGRPEGEGQRPDEDFDAYEDSESGDEDPDDNLGSASGPSQSPRGDEQGGDPTSYPRCRRPCKGKRRRYKALVLKIENLIRANPRTIDLQRVERGLPPSVLEDPRCHAKLMQRLRRLLAQQLESHTPAAGAAAAPAARPAAPPARADQILSTQAVPIPPQPVAIAGQQMPLHPVPVGAQSPGWGFGATAFAPPWPWPPAWQVRGYPAAATPAPAHQAQQAQPKQRAQAKVTMSL